MMNNSMRLFILFITVVSLPVYAMKQETCPTLRIPFGEKRRMADDLLKKIEDYRQKAKSPSVKTFQDRFTLLLNIQATLAQQKNLGMYVSRFYKQNEDDWLSFNGHVKSFILALEEIKKELDRVDREFKAKRPAIVNVSILLKKSEAEIEKKNVEKMSLPLYKVPVVCNYVRLVQEQAGFLMAIIEDIITGVTRTREAAEQYKQMKGLEGQDAFKVLKALQELQSALPKTGSVSDRLTPLRKFGGEQVYEYIRKYSKDQREDLLSMLALLTEFIKKNKVEQNRLEALRSVVQKVNKPGVSVVLRNYAEKVFQEAEKQVNK